MGFSGSFPYLLDYDYRLPVALDSPFVTKVASPRSRTNQIDRSLTEVIWPIASYGSVVVALAFSVACLGVAATRRHSARIFPSKLVVHPVIMANIMANGDERDLRPTMGGTVSSSESPAQEKESRTREQEKIDSQLLYAIYQMRGEATRKGVPTEEIRLRKDEKGRVLVDVRARVTKRLISRIQKLGGKVVSSSHDYDSVIAYISLAKLETLARSGDVKFIGPPAEAMTH